ncbi:hypothetical protein B11Cv2_010160 [Bartonella sp. 1-1C]|nr:hypothetical protein B11Cv2_010160 [Bartonella sp. 1-1C]
MCSYCLMLSYIFDYFLYSEFTQEKFYTRANYYKIVYFRKELFVFRNIKDQFFQYMLFYYYD